jgi:hypothetical protein
MKQAVLAHWNLPWLPLTALVIFVVCFGAYVYWTFRTENKAFYEDAAQIPLEDPKKAGPLLKGQML